MTLLALTVDNWIALVSVCITILTVIIIPLYNKYKNEKQKNDTKNKQLEELPGTLTEIKTDLKEVKTDIKTLKEDQTNLSNRFDSFETQNLKYMINDAFFGYESVKDIPYETLLSAAQNCDLYTSKGLNHEIGARCKIIYKELERRQKEMSGGENNGN